MEPTEAASSCHAFEPVTVPGNEDVFFKDPELANHMLDMGLDPTQAWTGDDEFDALLASLNAEALSGEIPIWTDPKPTLSPIRPKPYIQPKPETCPRVHVLCHAQQLPKPLTLSRPPVFF